MKKIKSFSILIFFLFFFLLTFPLNVYAIESDDSFNTLTPSLNSLYKTYDYVIDKYDINIIVKENNVLDITENITAYFNTPKHGIYRTIPLKNDIARLDGSTSVNRTQVLDVSVDNKYTTSVEDGNYKIKIGSANETLTGKQSYVIKYKYNLGKDSTKDYDELYYNIIGNEWDTVIGNITFSITMPKDFDADKLGFSSGAVGSTSNNVTYSVSGNKVVGSYNDILDVNEALTVRCELEEGYFVDAGFITNPIVYLIFIIPAIGFIISLFLWYKYGRDDKVIETGEFYPPEGFNSLEIGFLYKGQALNQDVTSLLIYLANKGYIKISDSKKNDFKITKLKEYDGNDENERLFLNGLFSKKNDLNEVTSADLYDNFYLTMNKILYNINSRKNKNKIFENSAFKMSILVGILLLISIITIIIILITDNTFMYNTIYLISILIGGIFIIGIIFFLAIMPKRTKYGNEVLGKLRGFKNYLETAEKEKLEAMVLENPTYFYDILPYTYVLGVSTKWIKKFESISLQAPVWYDSPNNFDVTSFGQFMNSTMSSANNALSSIPSTNSSGISSSGGGFSGGGFGGGGGGSW